MRIFYVLTLLILVACGDPQPLPPTYAEIEAHLLEMNQAKSQEESDSIKHFIARKKWPMIHNGGGLYYEITEKGRGIAIENGMSVAIAFKVYLLDGTLCYETMAADPVRFKVGKDHVESGLHQLMPLLHKGDRVRVVLPSVLAFGFTGDKKKIPGDTPLHYEIAVLND
jgi:FKBP-type peptidyl-prolyl cis-trans isomerase